MEDVPMVQPTLKSCSCLNNHNTKHTDLPRSISQWDNPELLKQNHVKLSAVVKEKNQIVDQLQVPLSSIYPPL